MAKEFEFEFKELGKLKYVISIEVIHAKSGIFISQLKYIHGLLTDTNKLVCKPANTSIDLNHKLGLTNKNTLVDKKIYQNLITRLIYLYHTRRNITYVKNVISHTQFLKSALISSLLSIILSKIDTQEIYHVQKE